MTLQVRFALAVLPCLLAACQSPAIDQAAADAPPTRAEAQRAYDACLKNAARYVDTGTTDPSQLPLAVAPLCYPQFLTLEKVVAASLHWGNRRDYEHTADAGQLAFAAQAIEQERQSRGQRLAGAGP